MAYCTVSDLNLTGDIPLPSYILPQKFVSEAADEIDSHIGFIYTTPVNMDEDGGVARPARLLLKRTNVNLASGRLLLSIATAGEETTTHAYGLYLVNQAMQTIMAIASGEIVLPGAPTEGDGVPPANAPQIYNQDAVSMVDTFYDGLVSPNGMIDPARGCWPWAAPAAGG